MALERCGEFFGRGVAERGVRAAGVVVDPPGLGDAAGIVDVEEPVLVDAFIAEPAVEGFDEGILGRPSP